MLVEPFAQASIDLVVLGIILAPLGVCLGVQALDVWSIHAQVVVEVRCLDDGPVHLDLLVGARPADDHEGYHDDQEDDDDRCDDPYEGAEAVVASAATVASTATDDGEHLEGMTVEQLVNRVASYVLHVVDEDGVGAVPLQDIVHLEGCPITDLVVLYKARDDVLRVSNCQEHLAGIPPALAQEGLEEGALDLLAEVDLVGEVGTG